MAHLLGAERVSLEFPTRRVLDDVSIGVDDSDRIGVVGRNGDGKSSLLRVLSRQVEPDSGRVTVRAGVRIGVLDQRDEFAADTTVGHTVVGDRADHEWASDRRIRDVVDGLIGDLDWSARMDALSGGQRRRVALAALLVEPFDVLFLDEPTNHLDVEGITWLAEHLNARSSALVVVTHDRWFLDAVCTRTWEVHDGVVDAFEGGYAAYVLQRVERDRIAAATEAKRQNLMRKELAWLRRGAPARTSKPKFRVEAATRLIADEPPPRDTVELTQLATTRLGKDVVDLLDVTVDRSGHTVLSHVEWRIGPGHRVGLLGANGAGKSTLLSVVTGDLSPTRGRVKRGTTVRIAQLSQDLHELDPIAADRVSDVIGRKRTTYAPAGHPDSAGLTPGQLLERLGFTSAQLSTPVRDLSGGQRRRLQLMLVLLDEPNVLILDEPTNDLDTDMLAAMEDLLDSWPGTLLVVSHDRYLLERVTDEQRAVIDGHLRHLPGGVDEYLRLRRADPVRSVTADPTPTASATGISGADRHAARRELSSVERRLDTLAARTATIEAELAGHDPSDYTGLAEINDRLVAARDEHDAAETRWLELSEILA